MPKNKSTAPTAPSSQPAAKRGLRIFANAPVTQPHPVSRFFSRYKLLMPLISIAIIAGGTYLAVQLGKGYRPTVKGLAGTGLLAANSFPPGAEVYLDGKLTTATDDTLSLTPGDYAIQIKKDGFLPWEKQLNIQKELVAQTNATLFKAVASLTPLTLSGATNIVPSPDGQKIAYVVATASATAKNGLYVADLTESMLSTQRGPKQISKYPTHINLATSDLLWSPNSAQLLIHSEARLTQYNYLLEADWMNDIDALPDVTPRLAVILSQWEEDIVLRETKQFALLPDAMQQIATQSAKNIYFSPNEERVLYTGAGYAVLPEGLRPKPPSPNTQKETRSIEPNHLYIYDLVEDRNYDLGPISLSVSRPEKQLLLINFYQQSMQDAATPSGTQATIPLTAYTKLQDVESFQKTLANFSAHYSSIHVDGFQWYPDSAHVLITQPDRVEVIEYDTTNRSTIYSGPFQDDFVYPWPDGSRLIILTNLNPATSNFANLYTVDIR